MTSNIRNLFYYLYFIGNVIHYVLFSVLFCLDYIPFYIYIILFCIPIPLLVVLLLIEKHNKKEILKERIALLVKENKDKRIALVGKIDNEIP